MATPTTFDKQNMVYGKPSDMNDEQCGSLPVLRTIDKELGCYCIISCWELSEAELEEVIRTKKIWFKILAPGMYPVSISGGEFPETL